MIFPNQAHSTLSMVPPPGNRRTPSHCLHQILPVFKKLIGKGSPDSRVGSIE